MSIYKLSFPEGIMRGILRDCEEAEHPKGMSVHDGRTRIHANTVRRMLKVMELQDEEIAKMRTMMQTCPRCGPTLGDLLTCTTGE